MSEASQAVEQGLSPLTPVSVVIVNYQGRDHLAHTLPAVAALEGVITEVILVDNSSTDGSLELARELSPGITVIEAGGNLGPAAARNLGLEAARNRWVLLLDNDVICPPLTLRVLLAAAGDGVALVQPRSVLADAPETVHYDGGSAHCQGLISLDNFYAPLASAGAAVARDVDVVISLALLADSQAVAAVGGFDEDYFILFEDLDLSWRLRTRGMRLRLAAGVCVQHRAGTAGVSFREGPSYPARRLFFHARNRWMFLLRNLRWRTLLLLSPVLALYELAGLGLALASGHPLSWIEGELAVLSGLGRTAAARKRSQAGRTLPDRALLVGGPLTPTPDAVRGMKGFFYGALSKFTCAWWSLVRCFAG
ncbi:MAG: glycosyltransferase family 2 protein [Planctomycetota bacterium]|nr:glycosyltransferase family 2 protein [Planctomycetota bacterium]